MTELGNDIINRIYEAHVDENKATRASAECSRFVKARNIKTVKTMLETN
jgi:hypothetical protein